MMEESVGADRIDVKDLRCPQCLSRSFVAYGTSSVNRREVWETGVAVSFSVDPATHAFYPTVIECLHCMIRSRIKSVEVTQLENQVFALRTQIQDLTGEDPLGLGKEN